MRKNNKNKNKEEEKAGTTVGEYIDALYSAFPKEEFLGEPSHHYLFTIPEEQADSLGYLPDSRGHRDDRVKLLAHPSHPSRGTWNGDEFQLTDLGMQSPNYTLFGLNDGGQDPQAVLTYKGGAVLPEITVAPNGNYVENPYDNIIMRQKAKDQGLYYVKNYPVVNAEDEGLSDYFMNHKDVAGMAIGGGANGIDGPRRIVMNPYSDVLKTDLQKEGLVRIEAVRHAMDENNYKPSFELSEHQKNLQKTVFKDMPYGSNDEAFKQSIISRILVGDADDLQPTPEQEAEAARFIFNNDSTTANQKGEGGMLDTPKKWEDLSFQEKSEMMKIAIRNGVYSLPEIKQKYNEYAEGGKIHIDESKKGTFTAAATKHGMGVQEFASKVMSNPEDYSPEMRKKAVFAKNAAKWHCYGGNLFGGGGYKPSEAIKKRIAEHEGKAMTGAKDPLSGKYVKNNSFEAEARGFYNALPKDIRDQVLSNQGLADNLYSYSYNVGAGNFKKRVVPTLQKYYKGQASIEDIENSMWASGDSKLRGLQRRRAQERAGVRSALWDYQMNGLNTAINNPMPVFMQDPSQVYSNPLASYEAPVIPAVSEQPLVDAAIRDAYTPEKIAEEERKDRAVLLGSVLNNFNQSGEYSPFINAINVLTGRGYSRGGHLFDGKSEPVNVLYRPEDNVVHRVTRVNGDLVGMDPVTGRFYDNTTGNYIGDHVALEDTVVTPSNGTIDDMGNIYQTVGGVTHMTTSDGKHIILGEKPVSNVDPVGEFFVEGTALSPLFKPVERVVSGVLGAPEIVKSGRKILSNAFRRGSKKEIADLTKKIQYNIGTEPINNSARAETAKAVEEGKNRLLSWVTSDAYKKRLLDEPLYRHADNIQAKAKKLIEDTPADLSRTTYELGAMGETRLNPIATTTLPDGSVIHNLNTGANVSIGSNLGGLADETASHEYLHLMTANSKGIPQNDGITKVIDNGWEAPISTWWDSIKTGHIRSGEKWQEYIMDQNNSLLPQYDNMVKTVMETPEKAIDLLKKSGKTTEEAEGLINNLKQAYEYMYDIQEQRAHLQTLYLYDILPKLKNPNSVEEIEKVLTENPELLKSTGNLKMLTEEIRPGSIHDYAKYFASALSTLPAVTTLTNNKDK